MFWSCFRHNLVMFQTCFGHVSDMFRSCFRHDLVMFQTYLGHVLDMFWASFGHVLGITQTCVGHHPDKFKLFFSKFVIFSSYKWPELISKPSSTTIVLSWNLQDLKLDMSNHKRFFQNFLTLQNKTSFINCKCVLIYCQLWKSKFLVFGCQGRVLRTTSFINYKCML